MSRHKWAEVPKAVKAFSRIFGMEIDMVWVEDQRRWSPRWECPDTLDPTDLSGLRVRLDFKGGNSVILWNSEWGGVEKL